MRTRAKRIAWTAIGVHLTAIALSFLYIAPAKGWPLPSWAGWCATWVLWVIAALTYASVLAAWEDGIGVFTALALCGCVCDAFHVGNALLIDGPAAYERWESIYRPLSLGVANAIYLVALLGITLKSSRDPGFPRWLMAHGIAVFLAGIPLSIAGFTNRPSWDVWAAGLGFGVFLPWIITATYGWIIPRGRHG
jgi:hypothetical protein